jgi:hypothetical protein
MEKLDPGGKEDGKTSGNVTPLNRDWELVALEKEWMKG